MNMLIIAVLILVHIFYLYEQKLALKNLRDFFERKHTGQTGFMFFSCPPRNCYLIFLYSSIDAGYFLQNF